MDPNKLSYTYPETHVPMAVYTDSDSRVDHFQPHMGWNLYGR